MAEKKETKPKAEKKAAPAKAAAPKTAPVAVSATRELKPAIERRRVVVGTVVSDKMQKTIVVKVDRRVRHGMYGKYVTRSQRFKAHDEKNDAKIGDQVALVETRPLSRDKRWALQKIVRRATQAAEVTV